MTDIIDSGDDQYAMGGEAVGYVPCFEQATAEDIPDDSEAIDGTHVGRVANGTEAGDFADSDDSLTAYGSSVGFVAKPCVDPDDCSDGITDDFNRVVAETSNTTISAVAGQYMGTATCDLDWDVTLTNHAAVSVDGRTIVTLGPGTGTLVTLGSVFASLPTPNGTPYDTTAVHSYTFELGSLGDPTLPDKEQLEIAFRVGGGLSQTAHIWIYPSDTSLWQQGGGATPLASAYSQITWTADLVSGTPIPLAFWVPGTVYTFAIYDSAGDMYASVTDGLTTYSTIFGVLQHAITYLQVTVDRRLVAPYVTTETQTVYIDDLIVPEVTVCSVAFLRGNYDDFQRTGSPGWGGPWLQPSGASGTSVVPGYGTATLGPGVQRFFSTPDTGVWQDPAGFILQYAFWTDQAPGGTDRTRIEFFDDTSINVFIGVGTGSGSSGVAEVLTAVDDQTADKNDFVADRWYWSKFEYRPGGVARLKVWEQGEAEPGSWLVTATAGAAIATKLTWVLNAGTATTEVRIAQMSFEN